MAKKRTALPKTSATPKPRSLATSRIHWRRFVLLFAVLLLVLSVVSAAVGRQFSSDSSDNVASVEPSYSTGSTGSGVRDAVGEDNPKSGGDNDVIRTATLTESVHDVRATVNAAEDIAIRFGGRLDSSNITDETSCEPVAYDMMYGEKALTRCVGYAAWFVVRVPATSFDAVKGSIRELDENQQFDSETTSVVDVTKQLSDYDAELSTLKSEEEALQGLLKKATELSDVLAIRQQLATLRAQIESLQSQLKEVKDQVQYATLTVYLDKVGDEASAASFSARFSNAFANLKSDMSRVGTFLIYVIVYALVWLPLLVMLFVLAWLIRRFIRRHWR